jgi:hypothetical protein
MDISDISPIFQESLRNRSGKAASVSSGGWEADQPLPVRTDKVFFDPLRGVPSEAVGYPAGISPIFHGYRSNTTGISIVRTGRTPRLKGDPVFRGDDSVLFCIMDLFRETALIPIAVKLLPF